MICVVNRIPVARGYEEAFESRFKARAYLVEEMPGFIRNEILRPVQSDCYLVKTYWEDMASFESWCKSDAFRQAHASHPPSEMFAGPNVLEIHEVLSVTEKKGAGIEGEPHTYR